MLGEVDEKGAIATTQIDLQRPVAAHDFIAFQSLEVMRRNELLIGNRGAGEGASAEE